MASFPHGDAPSSDEEDAGGSLLEPVAVLRLLMQFLGAGDESEESLALRERAGTLVWDLSATAEHCKLLARHVGALLELLASKKTPERFAELAVGTLANVASLEPSVLGNASVRGVVCEAYASASDPGVLTEVARFLHVAVTQLRATRFAGAEAPRDASLRATGDAWAEVLVGLKDKTLFVLRNSLDCALLARVFELCFALRFFVDADGRGDVFASHCEGDALLSAVTAALASEDHERTLGDVLLPEGPSGLDAALRVLELCSLHAAERSMHDEACRRAATPDARRDAVACLARVLTSTDRSKNERLTCVVALANFAPTSAELLDATGRAAADVADLVRSALDVALDPDDGGVEAAAAAIFLYAALGDVDLPSETQRAATRATFAKARDAGLDLPDALLPLLATS